MFGALSWNHKIKPILVDCVKRVLDSGMPQQSMADGLRLFGIQSSDVFGEVGGC